MKCKKKIYVTHKYVNSVFKNHVIFADVYCYTFFNKRYTLSDFKIFLINTYDNSTSTLKFIAAVLIIEIWLSLFVLPDLLKYSLRQL